MTTIGLFEPSYHHFLIPPMATVALEAADNVTIFTTEENRDHAVAAMDDAAAGSCKWVRKSEDESFRSLFEQVEQATAELDVVWTITPYGPPEIAQEQLMFSPRCPSVTLLHDTSRFAAPKRQLLSKLFSLSIGSVDEYLPASVRGRAWNQSGEYLAPYILDNYDCVLPLYPSITEYVEQVVKPDAIVDWFLYDFYRPNAAINHEHLQITIPGRVTETIRNYGVLFDSLDNLSIARERLTVCLLGSPTGTSGDQIISECERYERRGYNIQYYPSDEWIPAANFDHQMARTDLIFAPISIRGERTKGGGNRIRGKTITSGAIADAVRIGRPLVMPEEFTVTPEFEGLITTYESSTDATKLIESWVSSETTRQKLQQRAEHAARQFSLEKQAQRFE